MPTEIKGLNEECGVFGIFDAANASQLTYTACMLFNIAAKKVQELSQLMGRNFINTVTEDCWRKCLLIRLGLND